MSSREQKFNNFSGLFFQAEGQHQVEDYYRSLVGFVSLRAFKKLKIKKTFLSR